MRPTETRTSILVDLTQQGQNTVLEEALRPRRASVSTNCFTVLAHAAHGHPSLVLHNFDPGVYNTWYPFFHFTAWDLGRQPSTYAELIAAVSLECPEHVFPSAHRQATESQVRTKLGLCPFLLSEDMLVPQEVWLKYSKSKDQWTAYRFDYFAVTEIDNGDVIRRAQELNLSFLPLSGDVFETTLATGTFQNRPVVDNILRLLSDPAARSRLIGAAI